MKFFQALVPRVSDYPDFGGVAPIPYPRAGENKNGFEDFPNKNPGFYF